jgi:Ca2+-binding EF-hand superfamily protein
VQEQEQEPEQEQEQEQEKEKEEEKIEELEEEEFVRQKYARDNEDPVPWQVDHLAHVPEFNSSQLGFYPMSSFAIFKGFSAKTTDTLKFPEFLWISKNSYNPVWSFSRTLRRLKNVIVVLEYEPNLKGTIIGSLVGDLTHAASSVASNMLGGKIPLIPAEALRWSPEQEALLLRCFTMLDLDDDGKLSQEDILKVMKIMGVDSLSMDIITLQYKDLMLSKGGFTFGVFQEFVKNLTMMFKKQVGKFYVLLSLQEAEHFRGILHSRQHLPLVSTEMQVPSPGSTACLWFMQENEMTILATSKGFSPASSSNHNSMVNSFRFMNSDTHYSEKGLTILLRVLEGEKIENRESWFLDVRQCRRRRQVAIDATLPIDTVFNTKAEFEFMEYKTTINRFQVALEDTGMGLSDAFRAINSSNSGLITCSELYGGLEFFGIPFTPQQVYDFVKKITIHNEGLISYEDFRLALCGAEKDSDKDTDSSRVEDVGDNSGAMFEPIPPRMIPELVDITRGGDEPMKKLTVNEDITQRFKIKVRKITKLSLVWNSQATQSQLQVSLWTPSLEGGGSFFSVTSNKGRICLGHYASKGFTNPLKSRTSGRYQFIEVTDQATMRMNRGRVLKAVLDKVCPHPTKFKQVWHFMRGERSLFAWKAVPPDSRFVALGMICTTTEAPPDTREMRCVPLSWCEPAKEPPIKIWDDTGAGGGKPGSLWTINSMDMIAVVPGHEPPTDTAYELNNIRFFLEGAYIQGIFDNAKV